MKKYSNNKSVTTVTECRGQVQDTILYVSILKKPLRIEGQMSEYEPDVALFYVDLPIYQEFKRLPVSTCDSESIG
jgi:hypothetical protein